jgi:hypothetical protein
MNFRLSKIGSFEAVADPLMHCYLHSDSLSADPDVMLRNLGVILDTTLLADLRGVRRWAWRRRILAWQLSSAALIARDNKLKSELCYFVRSVMAWPSPFWQPRRFACLAVSLRNVVFQSFKGTRERDRRRPSPAEPG